MDSFATSASVIFRSSLSQTLKKKSNGSVFVDILNSFLFFFLFLETKVPYLLYRMSVRERRIFCLITVLTGGGTGDGEGWGVLDDEVCV